MLAGPQNQPGRQGLPGGMASPPLQARRTASRGNPSVDFAASIYRCSRSPPMTTATRAARATQPCSLQRTCIPRVTEHTDGDETAPVDMAPLGPGRRPGPADPVAARFGNGATPGADHFGSG